MTKRQIILRAIPTIGLLIFVTYGAQGSTSGVEASETRLATIIEVAENHREDLIALRRNFHMYPELPEREVRTASIIADRLEALGLEVRTAIGGHGVVGILRGAHPGPVIGYRADMDAVLSEIVGDQPYRSRIPGVNHVCGHDVHTTVGIGIATILTAMVKDLKGTVVFIFQPAEEGAIGARAMLKDGVLDNPVPEAIFAMHTLPIPVGTIMVNFGAGVSGHQPFEIFLPSEDDPASNVDELMTILNEIETVEIVPEEVFPHDAGVSRLMDDIQVPGGWLTSFKYVGARIQAKEGTQDRKIVGRIGAPTMPILEEIKSEVRQAVDALNKNGASFTLSFSDFHLPAMNMDHRLVENARTPIADVIGTESVLTGYGAFPWFGEDFSFFLQQIPGAFFYLGVANAEKGIRGVNHMPDYDVDEESILIGTKAMSNVLLDYGKSAK